MTNKKTQLVKKFQKKKKHKKSYLKAITKSHFLIKKVIVQ